MYQVLTRTELDSTGLYTEVTAAAAAAAAAAAVAAASGCTCNKMELILLKNFLKLTDSSKELRGNEIVCWTKG